MNKMLMMAGGMIGGLGMAKAPLAATFLAGLAPVTTFIGAASVIVFSGALIYYGVQEMIRR